MRIKIISSESGIWYENKIGSEFTVTHSRPHYGAADREYIVPDGEAGIYCSDFIVIKDERYPTLSKEYFQTG